MILRVITLYWSRLSGRRKERVNASLLEYYLFVTSDMQGGGQILSAVSERRSKFVRGSGGTSRNLFLE